MNEHLPLIIFLIAIVFTVILSTTLAIRENRKMEREFEASVAAWEQEDRRVRDETGIGLAPHNELHINA